MKREFKSQSMPKMKGNNRNSEESNSKLFVWFILIVAVGFWGYGFYNYQSAGAPQFSREALESKKFDDVKIETSKVDTTDSVDTELISRSLMTERVEVPVVKSNAYNFSVLKCPEDIFKTVDSIAKSKGIPTFVWYTIAGYESGFNPKTRNVSSTEDSRGLFQVNTKVHKDIDNIKVYGVRTNAEYQLSKLLPHYHKAVELGLGDIDTVLYVVQKGQRPDWSNPNVQRYIKSKVMELYYELKNAKI